MRTNCFLLIMILSLAALSAHAQTHTTVTPSANNYNEITLAGLLEKLHKGDKSIVVLDVRSPGEFHDTSTGYKSGTIGHIKGAINLDIQELRAKPEAIKQLYPYKDKDIYVICSHSYRSRVVSNMLLADGFTHVTNTKGGMSEWYRDYPELEKYMKEFYVTTSQHSNMAPATLYKKLTVGEEVVFMSFTDSQQQLYDTNQKAYYKHLPDFKYTLYFDYADSAAALQKAKAAKGKTIVVYNTTTGGGAEMVEYLTRKGIPHVYFLVGGLGGFIEYSQNYAPNASRFLADRSKIEFATPPVFCEYMKSHNDYQIVDLRPDSLFNKPTEGTKLTYKNLKGAVNFPVGQSANTFVQQFPDKSKRYIFTQTFLVPGTDLADELINRGYRIGWIIGGNERWEWYTNNVVLFAECGSWLEK